LGKHILPERVEVLLRCQLGERYSQPGTMALSEWMDPQSQSYDTYLSDEVGLHQPRPHPAGPEDFCTPAKAYQVRLLHSGAGVGIA